MALVLLLFPPMKEAPRHFPTSRLVKLLETNWAPGIRDLEYLPLGFGAHHWRANSAARGDLFVSVHDVDLMGRFGGDRNANFAMLGQAIGTARWLESVAGLEFVLGPFLDGRGKVVRKFAGRFAVHVYPWFECATLEDLDGSQTAHLVGVLHGVTHRLPPHLTRVEDFAVPHRHALEAALREIDTPWASGPYAEPARDHLRAHERDVRALLVFYDRGAARAAASRPDWVVTHGEPRGPNLIRAAGGSVRLIDWDTVLIAPRERDLWELPRIEITNRTYQAAAQNAPIDADRLRLYEAWYTLAELSVYLAVFRAAHREDRNVILSWQNYLTYPPTPEGWPELVPYEL